MNYAYNASIAEVNKEEDICKRVDYFFQPHQVFQLVHTKSRLYELNIFNCVMFQKRKCEPEWKIVNKFSRKHFKWISEKIVTKYDNFHKCQINFFIHWRLTGMLAFIGAKKVKDKIKVSGMIGEFLNLFANIKEIHVDYIADDKMPTSWSNELEYYFGRNFLIVDTGFLPMECSFNLMTYHSTFMVTPGTKLTPAENLYMPFEVEVWVSFILSIVIGLACIFIVKVFPKSVQQFVFGEKNDDPVLNLSMIFFGIGLVKVFGRNFARYLFMVFTLYCLVIRNAYQGKMFEFITGDLRHPRAETLQDIFDMKLPMLFVSDAMNDILKKDFG